VTGAPSTERHAHTAFGILTLAVLGLTATLSLVPGEVADPYAGRVPRSPAGYFAPYFGDIPPLLVVGAVAALGAVCLHFLGMRNWSAGFGPGRARRGLTVAAAGAALFGAAAVLADVTGVFPGPADLNVPPPYAMLFYPVVGYVVEIVFKALPLAVLLAISDRLFRSSAAVGGAPAPRAPWPVLTLVALLEPGYQLGRADSVSWGEAYAGVHVFAINLAQLHLLKRYGFVTMYWFRLVYYAIWHVIWGYLRLSLLF
jgi:hypothetical protein